MRSRTEQMMPACGTCGSAPRHRSLGRRQRRWSDHRLGLAPGRRRGPRLSHERRHVSLGERIAGELGRGTLDQVYIVATTATSSYVGGEEAVLTALAREDAKLGLVFLDMRVLPLT